MVEGTESGIHGSGVQSLVQDKDRVVLRGECSVRIEGTPLGL